MDIRVVREFPEWTHKPSGRTDRQPEQVQGASEIWCPGVGSVLTAMDFESLEGDSLIQLPTRLRRVVMPLALTPGTVDVEVSVLPNRQGRIAGAEMRFEATSFDEASAQTHAVLAPLLSRLSFDHEVVIDTVALEIATAYESRFLSGRVVGRHVDWVPQERVVRSTPETRSLLGNREGLTPRAPSSGPCRLPKSSRAPPSYAAERGAAAAASGGLVREPRDRIPPMPVQCSPSW